MLGSKLAGAEQLATLAANVIRLLIGDDSAFATAGVRSSPGDRTKDGDSEPPTDPDEEAQALHQSLVDALSGQHSPATRTYRGPQHVIRILHRPGEPPRLQARPSTSSSFQPFTLIAHDTTGEVARLSSTAEGLPVASLADLPPHLTHLSLQF